jgi:hypothetical protein
MVLETFFHVNNADMFCSIEKPTLYMHKSIPEYYNMINSKTTLGIIAIFAASMLVTGALLSAPSYASGDKHKDKDGVSGDGNTNLKWKNINKQPVSGFDNEADNEQVNCIPFKGGECATSPDGLIIGPP